MADTAVISETNDSTKKPTTTARPKHTRRPQPESDSDIVWGADAIGRAIGVNARKAFHLMENGVIPARKVGGRWAASRRRLIEFFSVEGE
jgi:hypothetical protein